MDRRVGRLARDRDQRVTEPALPTLPATRFDIARALTPTAVAAMYGGTTRDLAMRRRDWEGPVYYDFAERILYMPEDVRFWIELQRRESLYTSLALEVAARQGGGE